MDAIVVLLPALVCGAMMVGCAVMMSRMHGGASHKGAEDSVDPDEVKRLRQEVAQLRAEQDERVPHRR